MELEEEATVVRVVVAGSQEAVVQVRESLSELLGRLGLDVVVRAGADETVLHPNPDALARAFVDLRTPTAARVVVLKGDSPQELERRTLPTAASQDLAVEEACHVLFMIVESSLHARDAARTTSPPEAPSPPGPAPAPAPPPEEPAKPPPEPPKPQEDDDGDVLPKDVLPPKGPARGIDLTLGVFGGATAFSSSRALPGFGAGLDAGARYGSLRTSAMLSVRAFLPEEITRAGRRASLRAEAARLLVCAEWTDERVSAGAALGGGLDRVTLAAGESSTSVESVGTESRVDPVLEAGALGKVRLSRTASAFLHLALDVDLAPHRYVTEDSGQLTTFFAPSRFRPVGFLGVQFPLLEEGTGE
ncbi:MAG TPA: hypothetical protein VHE30_13595 [Polyangiaceae bacterium]|nr:hypothetical protein [Polyangiaceae bacterium]